ncbi:MAG: hypothetical protein ACP5UO_02940 [Thermoplasmata archaeon]
MLVIGLILVGFSLNQVESKMPLSTAQMTPSGEGYFHSGLIVVSAGSEIIVSSNSTVYLIPSQDIALINSTNAYSYGLHPSLKEGNSALFTGVNGSFYIVVPGSNPPVVRYSIVNAEEGQIAVYGLALISGIALLLGGIIAAVIGLFLKKRVS